MQSLGSLCKGYSGRTAKAKMGASQGVLRLPMCACVCGGGGFPVGVAGVKVGHGPGGPRVLYTEDALGGQLKLK